MTRYRTIVADPPWPHDGVAGYDKNPGKWSRMVVREMPYLTMTLPEICAVRVADFAERDARLFMWTTNRHLPDSFAVLSAWGFKYRQTLVWAKTAANPLGGSVTYNAAEYLLVANMGAPSRIGRWPGGSVITAPSNGGGDTLGNRALKHSRKPDVFLDLVEQVSPGPYLELFARRQRLGWDTWGNEALEHVDLGEGTA